MKNIIRKKTIRIKVNWENASPSLQNITFRFPNDNDLKNVHLWGMQTFCNDTDNQKADIDYNLPILFIGDFKRMFINLVDVNNNNFLKNAPASVYHTTQDFLYDGSVKNVSERDTKYFSGQLLDLQNSYITFAILNEPLRQFTGIVEIDFYYSYKLNSDVVKLQAPKLITKNIIKNDNRLHRSGSSKATNRAYRTIQVRNFKSSSSQK